MPDPDAGGAGGDPRYDNPPPPRPAPPKPAAAPGGGRAPAAAPGDPNYDNPNLTADQLAAEEALYGIPTTQIGAQFLLEEKAGAGARGQGNPFAGWTLPKDIAGDFWAFYQLAETFAANTGWRFLLTPQQLVAGLHAGLGTADALDVYKWMAQTTGVDTAKMPWAASGLSHSQYDQATGSMDSTVYDLTGQSDWGAAGLDPALRDRALAEGWSSSRIQDYILKSPTLSSQYGWLKHQMNYQSFQNYKVTNRDTLQSRFGSGFTDQQALLNLSDPLSSFHAQATAFGTAPAPQAATPSGYQSAVR